MRVIWKAGNASTVVPFQRRFGVATALAITCATLAAFTTRWTTASIVLSSSLLVDWWVSFQYTNSTRFLHLQAMRATSFTSPQKSISKVLIIMPSRIMLKFIFNSNKNDTKPFFFQLWIIQDDFFRRCAFTLTNTSFDKNLAERDQTTGSLLHELRYYHHDFMAPQRGGWAGLQRLRTLP